MQVPDSHKSLLTAPVLAHLATLMPDGRPQVHPVWCDYDGTWLRVNAANDRQKARNLRRRRWATVLLIDPVDPYFWMEIRGRVFSHSEDGGMAHMHLMARKYTGQARYVPVRPNEVRVIFNLAIEHVITFGSNRQED